jgi:hypothetical protein
MSSIEPPSHPPKSSLRVRLALALFIALAIGVVWFTNLLLT